MPAPLRVVLQTLRVTSDWVTSKLQSGGFDLPPDLVRGAPNAILSDEMVNYLKVITSSTPPPPAPMSEIEAEPYSSASAARESLDILRERLDILFEQERKHLELLKEFKEEIKFANTMEEDLRRERAAFFSQTLKEIHATLRDSQVDDGVAGDWIRELVRSYTSSLDVSGELVRTATLDQLARIQSLSRSAVAEADLAPTAPKESDG